MRTKWLASALCGLAVVAAAALSACGGVDKVINVDTPVPPIDERLGSYEQSLRAEADWLWAKAAYLETSGRPDPDQCTAREFSHQPVTMTAEQRTADDLSSRLVDQLDYAGGLVGQARDQWNAFCQLKANGSDTRVFLLSRLDPVYRALNITREALDLRAASRRDPTPEPTVTLQ